MKNQSESYGYISASIEKVNSGELLDWMVLICEELPLAGIASGPRNGLESIRTFFLSIMDFVMHSGENRADVLQGINSNKGSNSDVIRFMLTAPDGIDLVAGKISVSSDDRNSPVFEASCNQFDIKTNSHFFFKAIYFQLALARLAYRSNRIKVPDVSKVLKMLDNGESLSFVLEGPELAKVRNSGQL